MAASTGEVRVATSAGQEGATPSGLETSTPRTFLRKGPLMDTLETKRSRMDIKYSLLQLRFDAIRDAQKRSRLAFLAATIISLTIIIASWNAGLSWERHFALAEAWSDNVVTSEAQHQALSEWVKNTSIVISPLGIRIATSDIPILGSFGLLIASMWMYHCFRSENQVIGTLLTDTKDEEKDVVEFVFHGIASYLVFTAVNVSDAPIRKLLDHPRSAPPPFYLRHSFRFLIFLPIISVLFSILTDVLSVVATRPPFRHPHDRLYKHFNAEQWITVSIYEVIALILGTVVAMVCISAFRYEKATAEVIQEYAQLLQPPPKKRTKESNKSGQ
jgi:hypothetical protein